ncbi:MAG TPA: DNRLRE domain-containing protein [Planctomycetota bacterium]|nr:DNRLRE domain-containing protein [Planctomycetota bacterium]
MKRLIIISSGMLLGFLGWSVPGLAQTVTFQQGTNSYTGSVDTYIDQFMPTDTFGGVQWLEIRSYDSGSGLSEKNTAMIRFELSSIPSNATVTSASLKLYNLRAAANDAADVITLSKATGSWNSQWTWNMGVPASTASGVTCPSVASYSIAPTTPELYTINGMASLVQGWVSTPASNLGLLLSTTSNLNFRVASSDYSTVTYRPALTVTYTTAGAPPTLTVNSTPTTVTTQPLSVSGTATPVSPATITQVTWSNAEGGTSGTATGTTSWSASIPLVRFGNTITITATDSTGATATSTFTVTYSPPKVPGGGGGHKACGFGVAASVSGDSTLLALAMLALLVGAAPRRR